MSIFQRAAPARPAPPVPPVLVPTIEQCIQHIAAYDADRARVENGVGFNKLDSQVGNMLARKPFEQWHGWERKWAFKRLSFYRRQLEAGGLRWDLVPEPVEPKMPDPVKQIEVEERFYRVRFAHLGGEFDTIRSAISMVTGRRFDSATNSWLIPRDSVSAPQLRKFAESFGFECEQDLAAAVFNDAGRAELMLQGSRAIEPFMPFEGSWQPTPEGPKPWPHQEAGRAYAKLANHRLLIADEMGCIDGEASIKVQRAGATRTMTLATLHAKFNGMGWNSQIPTYVKSLTEDGHLKLNRVLGVLDKGVKPVVKVTLADGKSVRCTVDHPIATRDSGFIAACSLKVGELVLTNGEAVCRICGGTNRVSTYKYAKFVGCCRSCVYSKLRDNHNEGGFIDGDGYRRVHQKDHPRANRAGQVYEHILVMEQVLGRPVPVGEEIHHKNRDRADNRPENLEWFPSHAAHLAAHPEQFENMDGGTAGTGGRISFRPRASAVVSVEDDGEAHVYDIEMAAPDHNFVANGIVVHNTGKTGLALMIAEDAGCFEPDAEGRAGLLVICPAVVKANWGREAKLWLPHRSVTILKGTGLQSVKGDIVAANYDILRVGDESEADEDDGLLDSVDLVKLLKLRKWAGIILDEGHYAKDPGAQRTIAIAQIIKATQPRVRLILSGSPILNRLSEFVPAMNFAGILDRFGGATQFLANYQGSRNSHRLVEMNAKFREAGYLCRLKEHHAFTPEGTFVHIDDVPLYVAGEELRVRHEDPERDKATIEALRRALRSYRYELEVGAMKLPRKMPPSLDMVELSNRREYDRAVAEFRAWLWEQIQLAGGDMDSWNRALRAEALVRLNKLRGLVGKLKAQGAIEWARNFFESSDEKLVIFVEHDDPMYQILASFEGAACITGGQSASARQENIDRFQQDPGCRLMVAKTKAGGVGVTLTAANHIAILELPWNPGTLDQAVDRIHRGGQTKTVYPHYFLAENTIDQKMALLIDEKRGTVTAAIHGGEAPSGSLLTAMLEDIAA